MANIICPVRQTPFPVFLHNMLSQVEKDGLAHIIGWVGGGKAIKIHDRNAFTDLIIPRYFPQRTQFKSFLKQLGLYKFERIGKLHPLATMGREYAGAYMNPDFLKHDFSRCLRIQRIKTHSTSRQCKKKTGRTIPDEKSVVPVVRLERSQIVVQHPSPLACARHHSSSENDSCARLYQQYQLAVGGAIREQHIKEGLPRAGEDGSSSSYPVPATEYPSSSFPTTGHQPPQQAQETLSRMILCGDRNELQQKNPPEPGPAPIDLAVLPPESSDEPPPQKDQLFGQTFYHPP